jgi:hypothetical protein
MSNNDKHREKKNKQTIEGSPPAGVWVMLYECAAAFPVGILKNDWCVIMH